MIAAPETPAFDQAAFDDLLEAAGPERVADWLTRLRVETGVLLEDDAGRLDPAVLAQRAHGLVSQAGLLGFARLSMLLRAVEQACLEGRPHAADLLAARDEARSACAAMDALQGGLGPP